MALPFSCGRKKAVNSWPGGPSPWPAAPGGAVHPHVRGDYGAEASRYHPGERSIPTCVGTTPILALISGNFSVHPHVRGDYAGAEDQGGPRPRSIPTCVGTTEAASNPIIALTVHPHVRGDY